MASRLSKEEHHDSQALPVMGSGHLWHEFAILGLLQWRMGYIPLQAIITPATVPETRVYISKVIGFLLELKQYLINGDIMDQLKILSCRENKKPLFLGTRENPTKIVLY